MCYVGLRTVLQVRLIKGVVVLAVGVVKVQVWIHVHVHGKIKIGRHVGCQEGTRLNASPAPSLLSLLKSRVHASLPLTRTRVDPQSWTNRMLNHNLVFSPWAPSGWLRW